MAFDREKVYACSSHLCSIENTSGTIEIDLLGREEQFDYYWQLSKGQRIDEVHRPHSSSYENMSSPSDFLPKDIIE